jgi:predicted Zn finger-like uncharacterized protein
MDIRCDRCETEYELDDSIVTDAGTSVQCTTCGHTFVVTRRPPLVVSQVGLTPPAGIGDPVGPEIPEWTLSTDDGKVHRFRDLNVLQKWIVERKVTRGERVSRLGGPWVALGDLVELAPFFSVVDQADRARSSDEARVERASPAAPGLTPPTPGRRGSESAQSKSAPARSSPQARPPVSEDGPTVPNRRLPEAQDARVLPREGIRNPQPAASEPRGTGSGAVATAVGPGGASVRESSSNLRQPLRNEAVSAPEVTAQTHGVEPDLMLLPRNRVRRAVVVVVVLVLAAAGGTWWWMEKQHSGTSSNPGATLPSSSSLPGASANGRPSAISVVGATDLFRGALTTPDANTPAASRGIAIAPLGGSLAQRGPRGSSPGPISDARNSAATGRGPGGVRGPATSPTAQGAASSGASLARGRGPAPPNAAVADRSDKAARTGKALVPGSYEQLVGDADRWLERGKSAQADKLYAQALAARPDGVAALTGSAYVLLDRQRHFKAIETFRRALAIEPAFGPALFGIGESYRARGDRALALGAYRQYLLVAPSGTDAPAARRQIADLEAGGTDVPPHDHPATQDPASTRELP